MDRYIEVLELLRRMSGQELVRDIEFLRGLDDEDIRSLEAGIAPPQDRIALAIKNCGISIDRAHELITSFLTWRRGRMQTVALEERRIEQDTWEIRRKNTL